MTARKDAGGPSGAYHHGNLRQALIEAALVALQDRSTLEALSLRDLARQVGVSANAAYRHFSSKNDLLQAVAAEGFRQLQARHTREADKEAEPVRRLRAGGLAYVRFARENPALFRLMFGSRGGAEVSAELKEASDGAFQNVVRSAAEAGQLSPEDPRALVMALQSWAAVHGLAHLALDHMLDHFLPDVDAGIEMLIDQFKPSTVDAARPR